MSNFFKKNIGIILLILIFMILLPFFYLHQGLLLIDTGREFYIPQQLLNGEVLYKNILNIYGAFSYQFNAILFYIFGAKITTLYIAGIVNSLIIVCTIYLIGNEFLKKRISFLFSILIMFSLVFSTFLYNSNLTYSFAIIYALSSFLLSVLFLIKYVKGEKAYYIYLSSLFCGLSLSNKYEFILYPLVIIYVLFLKQIGLKKLLNVLFCFLLIPIVSYGSLILQGLNFDDIKNTTVILNNLVSSPILKMFFVKFGVFFDFKYINLLINENKIFSIFGIIPILNIILLILKRKEIYKEKALFVLVLTSILASLKAFFFLNVKYMGIFIFPICFLVTCILISKYQEKLLILILCICIFIFAIDDISSLKYKNYFLETKKGNMYTFKRDGMPIKQVSDYILNNTQKNDKVVILPEGSIINFITDRKTDDFYYNLSPLFYNDVFGEEKILQDFTLKMPEFFVILPINNIEYGSSFFGIDYAQNFYEMINNNYNLVENKNNIKILKRKN